MLMHEKAKLIHIRIHSLDEHDMNQLASSEANRSGSTLFSKEGVVF